MYIIITMTVSALIFLLLGLLKSKPSMSNIEFFKMNCQGQNSDYISTTVAYSLQVAVTIYFIFWGFTYGWSNLIFIITWLVGIVCYAYFAPKLYELIGTNPTQFSALFPDSKLLRGISVFLVALSLTGLIYSEIFFSAGYVASSLPAANYPLAYWVSALVLLFSAVIYASAGGMSKIILTDKFQLGVAYIASSALILFLLLNSHGNDIDTWILAAFTSCVFFLLFVSPLLSPLFGLLFAPSNKLSGSVTARLSFPNYAALLSAVICTVYFINGSPTVTDDSQLTIPSMTFMINSEGGIWPIIGFSLANVVWQFSDYTAYHRVSILQLNADADADNIAYLRVSILGTALSSPLTWFIGICIGMATRLTGAVSLESTDVYGGLLDFLNTSANSGGLLAIVAVVALSLFIVCILFSTIDSAFISIGQMLIVDLFTTEWRGARTVALFSVVVVILGIAYLHLFLKVDAFILLGVVYSWSLVFGPPFIFRLIGISVPSAFVIAAVLIGAAVGGIGSFNPLQLPYLAALVFPTISAIVVSALIMVVGSFFGKKES